MNKKKIWNLIAVSGLAIMSLLFAFILLDWNKVEAARNKPITITHNQPLSVNLTTSGIMSATNGIVSASDTDVCSGVWVIETVDSAGDVGQSTSLALEPTYPYTPHISYHDVTGDSLKYARLSGTTWLSMTIDSGGGEPGGGEISLALAPTYPYTPCISYYDHWGWALRYACKDGITWTIRHVEGKRAGLLGNSLALEPTFPYTPHISYYLPFGFYDLIHTYWNGASWVAETVDSNGNVGRHNSLALEQSYPYTPHISYYYWDNIDLKHAWLSGTIWLSETVDSEGDVGEYTSLALDSSDNPHISYYDRTNGNLKYARLNGTTWLSEAVDSGGDVGYFTSLELSQTDTPYISYYDATNDDLKIAHLSGTVWISQSVDSGGDVGQYSSLALDRAGCPHISYYDATNDDLKYAYLPPIRIYLPIILKNH